MLESISKKQEKIDSFHVKIKELNKLDEPSFFNDVFQGKKIEEPKEVIEAKEKLLLAVEELRNEMADEIITNRDKTVFDARVEIARIFVKYGIFEIMKDLICEEKILDACHKKVDRTTVRILGGYYE